MGKESADMPGDWRSRVTIFHGARSTSIYTRAANLSKLERDDGRGDSICRRRHWI